MTKHEIGFGIASATLRLGFTGTCLDANGDASFQTPLQFRPSVHAARQDYPPSTMTPVPAIFSPVVLEDVKPERQGSLTCRGKYEVEVGSEPAKKRTINLAAYAKHSYTATQMESSGPWRISLKKKARNIKIVCETPAESLESLTTSEAARLRQVIERDMEGQFKIMLAEQFRSQGVPVPGFLQDSKLTESQRPQES